MEDHELDYYMLWKKAERVINDLSDEWDEERQRYQAEFKKNQLLNATLLKALEWHAQYPFNNKDFERKTSDELYHELTAVLTD